jgi:hypothetical protein
MHEDNYARFVAAANQSGRDGIESESVMSVAGLSSPQEVMNLLEARRPGSNRTLFRRVATPTYPTYFAIGTLPRDQVPWTPQAHEAREASPYVALSTSRERLLASTPPAAPEFSTGTDFMVDVYYDTPDFTLYNNGMLVRSRNRQDRPGVGRRALLQSKITVGDDPNGMKRVRKRDVRNSGVTDGLDTRLHLSVQSGLNVLGRGSLDAARDDALPPFIEIYKILRERQLLPNLDGLNNVLLLNPQAVVFSERARFHFWLTAPRDLQESMDQAPALLDQLVALAASSSAPDGTKAQLREQAERLKNPNTIIELALPAAKTDLSGMDATQLTEALGDLQRTRPSSLTRDQVYMAHRLALAQRQLYKEFSEQVSPWVDENGARLRRQLEHAGTAALSMWFFKAAEAFEQRVSSGFDFIIDTFDDVRAVTYRDYELLTSQQKIMAEPLPRDKVFFAALVSEAQVELTENVTFESCFERAKAQPSNAALQQDKSMCEFLLSQMDKAQKVVSELRGQELLAEAQASGFTTPISWQATSNAKGENVLRIARDLPPPMPTLEQPAQSPTSPQP